MFMGLFLTFSQFKTSLPFMLNKSAWLTAGLKRKHIVIGTLFFSPTGHPDAQLQRYSGVAFQGNLLHCWLQTIIRLPQ